MEPRSACTESKLDLSEDHPQNSLEIEESLCFSGVKVGVRRWDSKQPIIIKKRT